MPDLRPRLFWWATLQALVVDRLLLCKKGSTSVLLFPTRNSRQWLLRNLQWDLWAFRSISQRASFIFFSRFQGLGSLFSDAQHVYTQTTFDANFCQACGSRVSGHFKGFGLSFKVENSTRLSRRVLEFSDTLTAKPYERQRSALEQQAVFGFPGFFVSSVVHFVLHFRRCY